MQVDDAIAEFVGRVRERNEREMAEFESACRDEVVEFLYSFARLSCLPSSIGQTVGWTWRIPVPSFLRPREAQALFAAWIPDDLQGASIAWCTRTEATISAPNGAHGRPKDNLWRQAVDIATERVFRNPRAAQLRDSFDTQLRSQTPESIQEALLCCLHQETDASLEAAQRLKVRLAEVETTKSDDALFSDRKCPIDFLPLFEVLFCRATELIDSIKVDGVQLVRNCEVHGDTTVYFIDAYLTDLVSAVRDDNRK